MLVGDRKADALRAHDDRGVDADDLAVRASTSGPPELPGLSAASVWITSSISRPDARAASGRAPRRTPVVTVDLEAERVADGDHELTALEQLGIAERRRRQRHRRVDAHQREIGVGIVADDARAVRLRPSTVVTLTRAAPSTTWLLVSTSPSGADDHARARCRRGAGRRWF